MPSLDSSYLESQFRGSWKCIFIWKAFINKFPLNTYNQSLINMKKKANTLDGQLANGKSASSRTQSVES